MASAWLSSSNGVRLPKIGIKISGERTPLLPRPPLLPRRLSEHRAPRMPRHRHPVRSFELAAATTGGNGSAALEAQQQGQVAAGGTGQEDAESRDAAGSGFVWTRLWWPLMPLSYLRTDRPNPVTLLGMPMVIWRDGGGEWRVFRDRCPHRLAPLSEGRVEADGSLACSYHGWRFDGSGACRRIPQSLDAAAEAEACSSRRACATAFPARVEVDMLWVWPDDSPDAAAAAAANPTVLSYDTRRQAESFEAVKRGNATAPGGGASTATAAAAPPQAAAASPSQPQAAAGTLNWFMREMPYGYEVLLENTADPSHLPFSHHSRQSLFNRNNARAMPMQPTKAAAAAAAASGTAPSAAAADAPPPHWTRPGGPDLEFDFAGIISSAATIAVQMPYHVMYVYRLEKFNLNREFLVVPVAPGRSRLFIVSKVASPSPRPLPSAAQLLSNPEEALLPLFVGTDPVVAFHEVMNTILDGDSVLMASQEEVIHEAEAKGDSAAVAAAEAATMEGTFGGIAAPAPSAGVAAPPSGSHAGVGAAGGGCSVSGNTGGSFWTHLYYMPAQCDTVVLAVRRWLEERGGGGPFKARPGRLLSGRPWGRGIGGGSGAAVVKAGPSSLEPQALGASLPGEAPGPLERSRRLDRYQQHTRRCPSCSARLSRLQQLQAAALAVQTVCLVGIAAGGGTLGAAGVMAAAATATATEACTAAVAATAAVVAAAILVGLAAVWAAAGWLSRVAERRSKMFLVQDYVHAEKD